MVSSYITDVLIVGAGPAGATLARALPLGCSTILLDKRDFSQQALLAEKPCGGLIAPDAQACLFHMGLQLPESVLAGPQIFGVRVIDLESGHERLFQRYYLNIHRALLDSWLYSLACQRKAVTSLTGRLQSFVQDGCGVLATLADGTTIQAKLLIGADGAASRVRHLLQLDCFTRLRENSKGAGLLPHWKRLLQPRRYLAMQAWFSARNTPSEYGAFFHQGVTDYYSWSIPKNGHLLIGSALPWFSDESERNITSRFSLLLEKLIERGYPLHEQVRQETCSMLCPSLTQSFPLGQGRVLLLGEAAGLISPSSAEGLSTAFRSAMSLASVLQARSVYDATVLPAYKKSLFRLQATLRAKCVKSAVIYHPTMRRLVLASGLSSFSSRSLW